MRDQTQGQSTTTYQALNFKIDVILTPLKPPKKSQVSSEAVNSSLYYLHVATKADEDILRQQSPSRPINATIPRKPVAAPAQRESPIRRVPVPQSSSTIVAPANGDAEQQQQQSESKFNIPRRPVISVETNTDPSHQRESWYANRPLSVTNAQLMRRSFDDGLRPNVGQPPPRRKSVESASPARSFQPRPEPMTPASPVSDGSRFHITLIRRDPASASQWNVGTISGARTGRGPIHIEIFTPGYSRFIRQDESLSLADLGVNLPSSPVQTQGARPPSPTSPSAAATRGSSEVFSRDVVAVRHQSIGEDVAQVAQNVQQAINGLRSGTGLSFSSDYNSNNNGPTATAKPARGYYTFTSLWNGTCTFVASIDGRSLKCKHTIPGPPSAKPPPAVTVAEIRFNIPFPLEQHHGPPSPTKTALNQLRTKGARTSISELINSGVQKMQHVRHRSRDSQQGDSRPRSRGDSGEESAAEEDNDRFALARERGGGGMHGRDVKLGKLVIEDEGIKMMDLVVAACMGVWWRSWPQL